MALSNEQIGELVKMKAITPSMGAALAGSYGSSTGFTPEGAEVLNADTQYTPEGAEILNPGGDPLPPGLRKGPGGILVNADGIPVSAPPIAGWTGGEPVDQNGVLVQGYLPEGLVDAPKETKAALAPSLSPDAAVAAQLSRPSAPSAAPPVAQPKIAVDTTGFVPPSAMPGKPMAASSGVGGGLGKPLTIDDIEKRVFNPYQMQGFGLTKKQIQMEGEREIALADLEAEKQHHNAVLLQNAQADAEAIAEENARKEEERRSIIAKARESLDEKWDELAKTEIDPDRYWNNKDTGAKVLAGIGLLLSGIGGGLQGTGRNMAMEVIETNINRDVDAQKATYAKKSDALKAKQSLFGQMMAEYGDERIADQATLATHWQQISTQLQVISAQSMNEVAQRNALDAKAFADNKVALYTNGVEQMAADLYKKMTTPAGPSALDKEFQKADMQLAFKRAEELGGQVKPTGDGRFVVVNKGGDIIWDGTKSAAGSKSAVNVITGFNGKGEPIYGAQGAAMNPKMAGKFSSEEADLVADKQDFIELRKLLQENGKESWGDAKTKAKAIAAKLNKKGYNIPEDPLEREFLSPFSNPNWTKIDVAEQDIDQKLKANAGAYLSKGTDPNAPLSTLEENDDEEEK